MKHLTCIVLFYLSAVDFATAQGIRFEKKLSWEQIQNKAREENKYIFLDAVASWCVPCKMMSADVFSQKPVGDLFNQYFISVQVQMDSSQADSDEIKKWRPEVQKLSKMLNVAAYPSLFFFSPEGKLVHKAVGFKDIEGMVNLGNEAKNPDQQLIPRLRKYEEGWRDPEFVRTLALQANNLGDRETASRIANNFINSLSEEALYDSANALFAGEFTMKSTDRGFDLLYKNWDKISRYFPNKEFATQRIGYIISVEEIYPFFNPSAEVKDQPVPDWNSLEKRVVGKYGAIGQRVYLAQRSLYYYLMKNSNEFVKSKAKLNKKFPDEVSTFYRNNDAWFVFENDKKRRNLKTALSWSKTVIEKEPTGNYYDTYANLLYKMGRRKEAIQTQEKALSLEPENNDIKVNLDKMRRGEPTWPVQ